MGKALDIGCGNHKVDSRAVGLDRVKLDGVDIVHDLDVFPYPFEDGEFDVVYAHMVLEHVNDLISTVTEIHRLLKPGGIVDITVPYYASLCAFQDPTHRNFFTEKTFTYFTPHNELSYYSSARFEITRQNLVANRTSLMERLRCLLPFRSVLRFVLLNMYDEIHVTMRRL